MRLGIVGCGAVAARYYIPAIKNINEIKDQIVFIDKDMSKAKSLAKLLGSEYFSDSIEYAVEKKISAAIVAVPHQFHYRVVKELINQKISVLCEKPLTEEPEQVEELISDSVSKGVVLAVNQLRRVFPTFQKIDQMITQNELGEVQKIEIEEGSIFDWPSETGFYVDPKLTNKGVLLDIGSHIIDLVCWWLKGKPNLIEYRDDSFGGPESVASLKAIHKNCEVKIFISRIADLKGSYRIIGESSTVECSLYKWNRIFLKDKKHVAKIIKLESKENLYSDFAKPLIENFFEAIKGKEKVIASAESVLESIRFISECYKKRNLLKMEHYQNLENFS